MNDFTCPHRGTPAGELLGVATFACEHPAVAGPCIVDKLLPRNHEVASCQRCELRKGGTRPPRLGPAPNKLSSACEPAHSAQQAEWFLQSCPPPPADGFQGQGIVTAAGGPLMQLNAYVLFRLLRAHGCTLPIECWQAVASERDERFAELVAPLGVECRDAVAAGWIGHPLGDNVRWKSKDPYPPRSVHVFSLKPFALLRSRFAEALWIDADSHPARDPSPLFTSEAYRDTGALAWRDRAESQLGPNLACLELTPPAGEEVGWESGQFLVDKRRHWQPLQLAHWLCANASHFFQHLYGDKDALFAAWLKTAAAYALAKSPDYLPGKAVVQPDFDGAPLFYHRCGSVAKLKPGQPDPLTQFPQAQLVAAAMREYEQAYQPKPAIAAVPRPLQRILQICPSVGTACGVANFAGNLAEALTAQGLAVETVAAWPEKVNADLILIQHEHGLFRGPELLRQLSARQRRCMLFAHSKGIEQLAAQSDGVLAMAEGMGAGLVVPHPANLSAEDPLQVQESLGIERFARVIGTTGFLQSDRQLDVIVRELLPTAERHDWLIYLLCPHHAHHARHANYVALAQSLAALPTRHLRIDSEFLPPAEQARRLRSLDLTWCWTRSTPKPYGSGTASDLWGSGARMVCQVKPQHAAVQERENVVPVASEDPRDLVAAIIREASVLGRIPRHDPHSLSWEGIATELATYLRHVCEE